MSPFINDTGEIGPCPGCESRDRRKDALEEDIALAQRDALAKMRRIGQLEKQLADMREEEPDASVIREVCAHWLQYHPTAKCPAGGKRWEKVRARLKDKFMPDRICFAIDVAHAFPHEMYGSRYREPVKGSKERVSLEYICRDETVLENLEKVGLGVVAKSGAGLPPARAFFAEAYVAVGDLLAEAGVPGGSTLDRVRHLTDEWLAAPEKPQVPLLRVVA